LWPPALSPSGEHCMKLTVWLSTTGCHHPAPPRAALPACFLSAVSLQPQLAASKYLAAGTGGMYARWPPR
jgi:hypothetical protein